MYGIKLNNEQIYEILNLKNKFVCFEENSIRGKVGLINIETYELVAYINITHCKVGTFEDYIMSKINYSFSYDDAVREINETDFIKLRSKTYIYTLENLEVLELPMLISPINESRYFLSFDESNVNKSYKQMSLF